MLHWERLHDNAKVIKEDLRNFDIPAVSGDFSHIPTVEVGEEWRREPGSLTELVPSYIHGKLGDFHFFRTYSDWVVNGPVPIRVAEELYADEKLRKSICVGCNPLSPPPLHAYVHVVAYLSDPMDNPWLEIATNEEEYVKLRARYPQNFTSSDCGFQGYKFYERGFHVRDGDVHIYGLKDMVGMVAFLEAIRKL